MFSKKTSQEHITSELRRPTVRAAPVAWWLELPFRAREAGVNPRPRHTKDVRWEVCVTEFSVQQ